VRSDIFEGEPRFGRKQYPSEKLRLTGYLPKTVSGCYKLVASIKPASTAMSVAYAVAGQKPSQESHLVAGSGAIAAMQKNESVRWTKAPFAGTS